MDRTAENNQALNQLFRIASQPIPMQQLLDDCLAVLLNLSWLSLLPKAGIFLTSSDESRERFLQLKVERNLGEEISTLCSKVMWGHCLCGRAALTGKPVHASCIDDRHETLFEGIQPHGHYNVPILSGDKVLGVLVFYLPEGTERDQEQLDFLVRSAGVLALAIELRRKEQELEERNRELTFQKNTLDEHAIVSIADIQGNIIYANDKFCEMSGFSRQELLGKNHRILKSGTHSTEFYSDLWRTISSGDTWRGEIKNRRKGGGYYWVDATIVPFMDEQGRPFQYVAVRTDITERKRIESALKQAQSVAQIGSWSLDLTEDRLMWSDEIFNIFGIDPTRFGASYTAFLNTIHPDDLDYVKEHYQKSLDGKFSYDIEHRIVRQDTGDVRWVHERCIHQRNEKGEVIRSDGTVQDITERKLAQEEIQRLAMTDHLTGLANRTQFYRKFDEYLKLGRREKMRMALLFVDLDNFKPVNDTYGHQVGDALLQEVASIFTKNIRKTDMVARLGGDEFAILLINPNSQNAMENIASQIIDELKKPISICELKITIGASIGIAVFPDNGSEQDNLIHKADMALYEAKKAGRNTYRYYT